VYFVVAIKGIPIGRVAFFLSVVKLPRKRETLADISPVLDQIDLTNPEVFPRWRIFIGLFVTLRFGIVKGSG
jgi:hypothetical protein